MGLRIGERGRREGRRSVDFYRRPELTLLSFYLANCADIRLNDGDFEVQGSFATCVGACDKCSAGMI